MKFVRPDRNVVLIGFMGTGKSSVGRELARRWGFRFLDTDAIIRNQCGKSIPEIFSVLGEPYFRDLEFATLNRLLHCRCSVIATGGGIVIQPRNLALLAKLGIAIWLKADQATIFERVSRNKNRPLLQTPDPEGTIARLLVERAPLYESAADLVVDSSGLSHHEVAEQVIAGLMNLQG
ncbi:MAG TPA: shikimate kinase [Chthoniobacterales bacterium]|nr:shikimate kinase [Chthoniobacterales bacterium]